MKFLVDEMPKSIEECPFSKVLRVSGNNKYGCEFPIYLPKIGRKAKCICESVENCNVLTVLKEK